VIKLSRDEGKRKENSVCVSKNDTGNPDVVFTENDLSFLFQRSDHQYPGERPTQTISRYSGFLSQHLREFIVFATGKVVSDKESSKT
jgi:hypothetical protein